jgi:hypothetical protein
MQESEEKQENKLSKKEVYTMYYYLDLMKDEFTEDQLAILGALIEEMAEDKNEEIEDEED